MSGAVEAVQAGLARAIGTVAGVHLFEGPPARVGFPHAVIGEAVAGDWGAKGVRGREVRTAVTLIDDGAGPARLNALIGTVEDAIEAMAPGLGGWRVASLVLLRARVARDRGGWRATIEYRVRVLAD